MDGNKHIRSIMTRPTRPSTDSTTRIGNVVQQLLETSISPRLAIFSAVVELWNELLPTQLRQHCKVADISHGRLKVLVDLPSYMYELQLCSSELLEELQRQCPRANIKKIKFLVR